MTSKFPVLWAQVVWRHLAMGSLWLGLCGPWAAVWAGVAPQADVPVPVFTAQSEEFELVGRLTPEGLRLWLDDAPGNRPVLNAQLTLELVTPAPANGQPVSAHAVFQAASADYLISPSAPNTALITALSQPGTHALNVTVLSDTSSDLLAGELVVENRADALPATDMSRGLLGALGIALVAGAFGLGRRSARGGAR